MSESGRWEVSGRKGRGRWGVWKACHATDGRRLTCTRLALVPEPACKDSAAGSPIVPVGPAVRMSYPGRTRECGATDGSPAVLTLRPPCFPGRRACTCTRSLRHEPGT